MLSGDVLRDYPKQVVSPSNAGNASIDMCEFLPWTQKYSGVDATIPVSQRKTDDARAEVGKHGPLARVRKGTPAERNWTHIPVFHDIRRRHEVPIVETILLLFLTKATSITAQHFRPSTNPDSRPTDLVLMQIWCSCFRLHVSCHSCCDSSCES